MVENMIISTNYTYYYQSFIAHNNIRRSQLSQIAIVIREPVLVVLHSFNLSVITTITNQSLLFNNPLLFLKSPVDHFAKYNEKTDQ